MNRFLARVQIHFGSNEDHDRMHGALVSAGFTHVVAGSSGAYYLPPGEYWIEHPGPTAAVYALAKTAAETVGSAHSIVIAQYIDLQFGDLYPA
jgi:hypothetical protein